MILKNLSRRHKIIIILIILFVILLVALNPAILILIFLGGLIFLAKYIYDQNKKAQLEAFLHFNVKDLDGLRGIPFENLLKNVFIAWGYQVQTTPVTGDQGADLILLANSQKIAVQAKGWGNTVGNKAVQEVYASISYYRANEGWVITNNYFTPSARRLAASTGVKLFDREDMIDLIKQAHQNIKNNLNKSHP